MTERKRKARICSVRVVGGPVISETDSDARPSINFTCTGRPKAVNAIPQCSSKSSELRLLI